MSVLDGWRFCPRCGGPVERAEGYAACLACGQVYWANAAPAVQGLVVADGRVLLGRRGIEPSIGKWDIPGGFLAEDEHPLDALRRELLEETGLEVEPAEFLLATLDPYFDRIVLGLTWLARVVGGTPRAGDDLVELRWFARSELPEAADVAFAGQLDVLSVWRDQQA